MSITHPSGCSSSSIQHSSIETVKYVPSRSLLSVTMFSHSSPSGRGYGLERSPLTRGYRGYVLEHSPATAEHGTLRLCYDVAFM